MNDAAETDLGVVCRLAHKYLGEQATAKNDVYRKLPRDFRGTAEDLVKDIDSSVEVPPMFSTSSTALSFIFQKIVSYQTVQKHHEAPSRLQRLTNNDNYHAKRVICELFKAWACSSQSLDDEGCDASEVECYHSLIIHLLYYSDRWIGRFVNDSFVEMLVAINRKLGELQRSATNSKHKHLRALERIYEKSCDLIDAAMRVTFLGVTDNHAEIEQFYQKRGPVSLKLMGTPGSRGSSVFWCTDYGQVVFEVLMRADPQRFKSFQSTYSVWTDEMGTGHIYECSSLGEAQQVFDKCKCCAVLVGPEGKITDKNWTTNQVLSSVLKQHSAMQTLNDRVDNYMALQRSILLPDDAAGEYTAAGSCGPPERRETAQTVDGAASFGAPVASFLGEVYKIKDSWMQSKTDNTGISEPFRGAKKVKWVEGLFEEITRSSDFPSIIMDVPLKLLDLIRTHVEVMGAVRGMIAEGGSKEALAAIYALRTKSSIDVKFAGSMEAFITSASLIHGFFQAHLFKGLEAGGKNIKGQAPSMQRAYLESLNNCSSIRDSILTEWHQLGLKVSDRGLAEEAKRIDLNEREAFQRLMSIPAPQLAIGAGSSTPVLQLTNSEEVPSFGSVGSPASLPHAVSAPVMATPPTVSPPVAMAWPVTVQQEAEEVTTESVASSAPVQDMPPKSPSAPAIVLAPSTEVRVQRLPTEEEADGI